MFHPVTTHLIFDLARQVVRLAVGGGLRVWDASEEETIECIQNCDAVLARKLLKRNESILSQLCCYVYGDVAGHSKVDCAVKVLSLPIEEWIKTPTDIERNWHLTDGQWTRHSETLHCNWEHSYRDVKVERKI
jgi:hypothetical protein